MWDKKFSLVFKKNLSQRWWKEFFHDRELAAYWGSRMASDGTVEGLVLADGSPSGWGSRESLRPWEGMAGSLTCLSHFVIQCWVKRDIALCVQHAARRGNIPCISVSDADNLPSQMHLFGNWKVHISYHIQTVWLCCLYTCRYTIVHSYAHVRVHWRYMYML